MLYVTVIEGKLLKDKKMFGKMDSYVSIEYQGTCYQTKVDKNGGLTPKWNQTLVIPVKSMGDDLKISCLADGLLGLDIIGE